MSASAAASSSSPRAPARWSCRAARRRLAIWYVMTTDRIKIPCRMITNSRGTSVSICSTTSPRDKIPHRIAAKMIPIGLFWPKNATAIPVKPKLGDVVLTQVARDGQDLLHPHQPRERARDEEQAQLGRAHRDPARAGRALGRTHRAGRVPQPGPTDEEPDHDRRRHGQDEQPGQVRARADPEELAHVADQRGLGELVGAQVHVLPGGSVRELQREVDRPRQEAHRDAVHHDGHDDLVGPGLHLEDAGDGRPDHAAEHGRDQDHDHVHGTRAGSRT